MCRRENMTPFIVASTASPFKFTSAVLTALEQPIEGIDDLKQLDKLSSFTNRPVPKNLAKLDGAEILHGDICEKDEMPDRVLKFAAN